MRPWSGAEITLPLYYISFILSSSVCDKSGYCLHLLLAKQSYRMATPERLNFEKAKNEAINVKELAGERPTRESFQLASEILDMRREKLELYRTKREASTFQYLDDKKEIVEPLSHNIVLNEELRNGVAKKGFLERSDISKTLESALRSIQKNTREGIALLDERLQRAERQRHPSPEDRPESIQKRMTQLQAQLESYRDFDLHGLESLKELAGEVFTETVQTPEDLNDALMLLLEEIGERLVQAKMKLEMKQNQIQSTDKLARWKVLEEHEASISAEKRAREDRIIQDQALKKLEDAQRRQREYAVNLQKKEVLWEKLQREGEEISRRLKEQRKQEREASAKELLDKKMMTNEEIEALGKEIVEICKEMAPPWELERGGGGITPLILYAVKKEGHVVSPEKFFSRYFIEGFNLEWDNAGRTPDDSDDPEIKAGILCAVTVKQALEGLIEVHWTPKSERGPKEHWSSRDWGPGGPKRIG